MRKITEEEIKSFECEMYMNEKARSTIQKYISAIRRFSIYLEDQEVTKMNVLAYREKLQETMRAQTVNGALSAIHAFLDYCGWQDCKVKLLKVQRKAFLEASRELSETEYKRLVTAADEQGNKCLCILIQTICATGIRIGELKYITVEAVKAGRVEICMKGKNRTILLPKELRIKLEKYTKKKNIQEGYIFRTRSGKPLDRSNIWSAMKKLCSDAKVNPKKVFPHNLRHLFARTFYAIEKNIAHLADVLGHSRIETTRIYVAVSESAHERILNRMKLII